MLTPNVERVSFIADALIGFYPLDLEYGGRVLDAAKYLGFDDRTIKMTSNQKEHLTNVIQASRNFVITTSALVSSFVSRANNAGFSPPDNPFSLIVQLNSGREAISPVKIDEQRAGDILQNIDVFMKLLEAEKEGKIIFDRSSPTSTQISSFTISIGKSGDGLQDLMQYLPDSDAIYKSMVRESLGFLDFKKRVPKVLFTLQHLNSAGSDGCLVGWKRMPDASGYVLVRRDIFENREEEIRLSNDDVSEQNSANLDYAKHWALSFYDNVGDDSVCLYLDKGVGADRYYLYKVKGYQVKLVNLFKTLDVQTRSANLSSAQRQESISELESLDRKGDRNGPNPFPVLAKKLLGDEKLAWIISAVNANASVSRGESRDVVRKFSFLDATIDDMLHFMGTGKFLIPADVSALKENFTKSISQYGVSQTIYEILLACGIVYFFEGRDENLDDSFDRAGTESPLKSTLLTNILSAADPETATIDVRLLRSNLPGLLGVSVGSLVSGGASKSIDVNVNEEGSRDTSADSPVQFLQTVDDGMIDLTTFDGIGDLMALLASFVDSDPSLSKVKFKSPLLGGAAFVPGTSIISGSIGVSTLTTVSPFASGTFTF